MSRIRGRGNKETELALMGLFRRHGIAGWRRHASLKFKVQSPTFKVQSSRSTSPRPSPQRGEGAAFRVRPDFVFPKLKVAVFVDGCFWHGCPKHATWPAHNRAFWQRKLTGNKARDRLVTRTLRRQGWRVLRIWEHELARTKAKQRSTPHPMPSPPAPLPSDGRGWRRTLPDRGGEGEARLVRRIEQFLAWSPTARGGAVLDYATRVAS